MGVSVLSPGNAAGPSFWNGNAALIATTSDVATVNSDGTATSIGNVGTGPRLGQPGIVAGAAELVNYAGAQWAAVGTLNGLDDIIARRETAASIVLIGSVAGKGGVTMVDTSIWRDAAGVLATDGSIKMTAAGARLTFGNAGQEQAGVGAAGAAAALPAAPTKYLRIVDSAGATLVVPAYAAA